MKYRYYHNENKRFAKTQIPEGLRVLQIGCDDGALLAGLKPSFGVGVFRRPEDAVDCQKAWPGFYFISSTFEELPFKTGEFDVILLIGVVGQANDIWKLFAELKRICSHQTRIVISYYNFLWEPVYNAAEVAGIHKSRKGPISWLTLEDLNNLLYLNGLETIHQGFHTLMPIYIPGLSALANRFFAHLPVFQHLCVDHYIVARAVPVQENSGGRPRPKCSVIVPTRNEAGNIPQIFERMPDFGAPLEVIFVDGNSTDGTVEKIEEYIRKFSGRFESRLIHQVPRVAKDQETQAGLASAPGKMLKLGKGDAVRKGFAAATGEILMILDSDVTVMPEDLPKFYHALHSRRGEFINGSRLVYPLPKEAMRLLNLIANKTFGKLFSWILRQPIKDTLCGTKALRKEDYDKIAANRSYFGDFDPFGDFDLLFGAARLHLKIVEIPVRYQERSYGDIKIQRFKHGWLLLKMCVYALGKLKFI